MSIYSAIRAKSAICVIENDCDAGDQNLPGFPFQGNGLYHYFMAPETGFRENSAETYTTMHVAESWDAVIAPNRSQSPFHRLNQYGHVVSKNHCFSYVTGLQMTNDSWMNDPGIADDDFMSLWNTDFHYAQATFNAANGVVSEGDTVTWPGTGGGNTGWVYEIIYQTASTGTIKIRVDHAISTAVPLTGNVIAVDGSNDVTLNVDSFDRGNAATFYWMHIQYAPGSYSQGTQRAARPGLWHGNRGDVTPVIIKHADHGYVILCFQYRLMRAHHRDPQTWLPFS